jgi:HK97 gp10 family phage protein
VARFQYYQRRLISLNMAAELFARAPVAVRAALAITLEEIGKRVAERAKSYLGVPQAAGHGGYPPWPPLAPSTLAHKGTDTPLLETGALRDDIHHVVVSESEVQIGTNVPYGRYLEFGTAKMPPRPFLRPAAMEVTQESREEIGSAAVRGILGGT